MNTCKIHSLKSHWQLSGVNPGRQLNLHHPLTRHPVKWGREMEGEKWEKLIAWDESSLIREAKLRMPAKKNEE